MAQTLSEIRQLLASHGLHPKKRFGQNFLHDANQMQRILAAAELSPGQRVLEVGPGTGALSERLLDAGAELIAIEVDRDLEPILRQRLGDRATLIFADVLESKHELNPLVLHALSAPPQSPTANHRPPATDHQSPLPFKLIANLPYNIASPLLINLLLACPQMSLAVIMVQREVAERIVASPGGKEYGPLTVMVQALAAVEQIGHLSPGCFWPAPEVESTVLRLLRRDRPLTDDAPALQRLLHQLFTRRRKQLGSILGRQFAWPPGIDPQQRPEQLTVEQLIALAGGTG